MALLNAVSKAAMSSIFALFQASSREEFRLFQADSMVDVSTGESDEMAFHESSNCLSSAIDSFAKSKALFHAICSVVEMVLLILFDFGIELNSFTQEGGEGFMND